MFIWWLLEMEWLSVAKGLPFIAKLPAVWSTAAVPGWTWGCLDVHIGRIINQTVMHRCTQRGGCGSFTVLRVTFLSTSICNFVYSWWSWCGCEHNLESQLNVNSQCCFSRSGRECAQTSTKLQRKYKMVGKHKIIPWKSTGKDQNIEMQPYLLTLFEIK